MDKIDDILNKICTLQTKDGLSFTGYFYKPKKNIWFNFRAEFELEHNLHEHDFFPTLCGDVNGKEVTILQPYCPTSSHTNGSTIFVGKLFFSALIIGTATYEPIETKHMYTSIPALSWFGLPPVFQINPLFEIEKNDNQGLSASYDKFDFYIHSARCSFSQNHQTYTLSNYCDIGLNFKSETNINEAITELFRFRQLLCVFADYGINFTEPFEFDFGKMININGEIITDENGEPCINTCYAFLNDNEYFDRVPEIPFRVRYSVLKDDFQEVHKKWLVFFSKNKPLISIYLEILANKSKKINRFLDLVRIVESYSERNRNDKAIAIQKELNDGRLGERHRYIDMFREYARLLPQNNYMPSLLDNGIICDAKIKGVANDVKLLRDYYTHYGVTPMNGGNSKEEQAKERFGDDVDNSLYHAQFSRILHLLMLAVIYREIGLSDEIIQNALIGGEIGRFGYTTESLFDG